MLQRKEEMTISEGLRPNLVIAKLLTEEDGH